MPSYWKHVNAVIAEADIIIEVLDARLVRESRNTEIEEKVARAGKQILFVINKVDLVSKGRLSTLRKSLRPSVVVSSRQRLGTTILKKKILELSRGKQTIVGILGYPNVGKSSLINALSGRGAARTSAESGYTKGMQKVRVDNKILLLDTPGVFPRDKDDFSNAKMGAVDYAKIKDPETMALQLIEENPKKIKQHYGVLGDEPEDILEAVGFSIHKLSKGGKADVEATSRIILKDWQTGKIWTN
jgi:ribosome biogenesis GTPase A